MEAPEASTGARMLSALSPRAVMAMAEGQPVVLKQFVQFCLIIVYPAWVVGMLVALAFYYAGYGVLWVLFAPIRLWMKKNRPDEYAASQLKN
ncbi:YggT family protein [Mycobacterium sp. BK086]|nr:YggT family protein [Mycobacterium sp. BK086]